ncbi:MAG: HesA/MoeB/ThiF family protein [Candidatus Binataceae bacterium]
MRVFRLAGHASPVAARKFGKLAKQVGADGNILIVGAGGLGVPAAFAVARAGVRHLGVIDPDPIELSNLPRQVLYTTDDISVPKVDALARRLKQEFGDLAVEALVSEFDAGNAADLIARYDFIIDATDNPRAKFLITDACVAARRPFVYAGVIGLSGQAMTVIAGRTACLRCLFEEEPDEAEVASCRDAGIIGPLAGAVGEIEAAEALSVIRGAAPMLAGRMLTLNLSREARVRVTRVAAREGCACGAWRAASRSDDALSQRNERI